MDERLVDHYIYHVFFKRDLCDVCTFWKPYVFNVLLIQWWVVDAVACCGCFDVLVICAKYHILIRCLPSYYWVEKYMRYRCYDSVYSTMKIKKKFRFSQILAKSNTLTYVKLLHEDVIGRSSLRSCFVALWLAEI